MSNLTIQKEGSPSRCEVCHQTDAFDGEKNFCTRCKDVAVSLLKPIGASKTRDYLLSSNLKKEGIIEENEEPSFVHIPSFDQIVSWCVGLLGIILPLFAKSFYFQVRFPISAIILILMAFSCFDKGKGTVRLFTGFILFIYGDKIINYLKAYFLYIGY